jgi:hypothetical protein
MHDIAVNDVVELQQGIEDRCKLNNNTPENSELA